MAMHGFSRHSGSGGGGGSGPVDYFIDDQYRDKEEGIWLPRDPLPEVIEGDPALMVQMIDALDYKHKYTSGVLSFTHGDTEKLRLSGLSEAIADINGRLKEMLFSGIAPEHQHILIVKQSHLDRLELHYVLPRHNYEVDRAWNPAPPGEAKFRQMDALVDFINVKYGLDDPRDPLRARATNEIEWEPAGKKATRETLNDFFKEAVIDGVINNREQLIDLAKIAGFEITRIGDNYVSMKPPGVDKAIRMKGEIYDRQFTSSAELTDTKTKSAERAAYLAKPAVAERYKQAVRERQNFIEKRFEKILSVVRTGKNYSETQKFNNTKRGDIIKIRENRSRNFADKLGNPPTNNNNEVIRNDDFGKEADAIIARAERVIYNTQQSATKASRVLEAGTKISQSAHTRVTNPTVKSPYGTPRSAPLASVGTAGLAISDVAGGIAGADTGDAESDRILTAKRHEAVESAQRSATRAKQDALRNQQKANDDLSI
ncbi:hypothetical protein [Pseudomonas sp. LD120]|uniref:hypothetical protein n=1 Tax=Pseudomonas sp. LD120 TaxID=485751 RepID=UPI00135C2644|nr:hypothetical protein [Pseudomonas sp. LD120]KAF0862824.1 hypothetical protein PLD_19300 [Pseudomonas sp. LD120]